MLSSCCEPIPSPTEDQRTLCVALRLAVIVAERMRHRQSHHSSRCSNSEVWCAQKNTVQPIKKNQSIKIIDSKRVHSKAGVICRVCPDDIADLFFRISGLLEVSKNFRNYIVNDRSDDAVMREVAAPESNACVHSSVQEVNVDQTQRIFDSKKLLTEAMLMPSTHANSKITLLQHADGTQSPSNPISMNDPSAATTDSMQATPISPCSRLCSTVSSSVTTELSKICTTRDSENHNKGEMRCEEIETKPKIVMNVSDDCAKLRDALRLALIVSERIAGNFSVEIRRKAREEIQILMDEIHRALF